MSFQLTLFDFGTIIKMFTNNIM